MANLINDELVNHTRAFVSDEGRLSWRFAKGSFTPLYRDIIKEELARVDDRLGGIQFKKTKGKPDLVIGHGDFIYVCSQAGIIGNIRWVNSDTRWPDWIHKRWIGHAFRRGYWGSCGYVDPRPDEDAEGSLPLP